MDAHTSARVLLTRDRTKPPPPREAILQLRYRLGESSDKPVDNRFWNKLERALKERPKEAFEAVCKVGQYAVRAHARLRYFKHAIRLELEALGCWGDGADKFLWK